MATNKVLREKYKQKRKEHPEIVWTIKQLFEWAVKNGCEDYLLLNIQDGAEAAHCYVDQIEIDPEFQEVLIRPL